MNLEYKFLVNNVDLGKLRHMLMPYVTVDEFAISGDVPEYTVRSIYFDTSKLKYYHEKIDGIKNRKKLRIRGYNDQADKSVVFLEIKNKSENFIGKNRTALLYHNLNDFLKTRDFEEYILTNNGFAHSIEDGERFLHHIYKHSLKPIILIVYEREAYYSKFDSSLRITLDKNLRYLGFPSLGKLYHDNELEYAIPKYFIMEIKFNGGFPRWLRQCIQHFNLSRRALSKYTICLDSQKMLNARRRRSALPFVEADDLEYSEPGEDIF